ncbi:MAG: ADP-forming succinate--CoA ligase subunit beta [Bacteroidales bacterium]|nr:ADP-forming succinate--CoA ligase subunit beta [Bacteroidales bacterium]
MDLHEYQSKKLLKRYGVQIPLGYLAMNSSEAYNASVRLQEEVDSDYFAVKAQVHAGGRGKGGGVKIAKLTDEVRKYAGDILGMMLVTPQTSKEGKLVRKVYIEQNIYYKGPQVPRELYLSLLLDRATGRLMFMYSPKGGMNIEQVAEEHPEDIFTEYIDPAVGFRLFQARRMAYNYGLSGTAHKNMVNALMGIYKAYCAIDASLVEINPLFVAADEKVFVADSKVSIDNNSLFRHPDIAELRDFDEEDPTEVEASAYSLNYVKLDGNVGCMVNGAGLAMATMDIIKLSGGEPANFLDVGGSANAERVEKGFRIILQDKNVKALLVNIFGGIVRCDRVAQGIIDAYHVIGDITVPIIVRLQGTNAEEAKVLIDKSGLKVFSAVKLQEAAELVAQAIDND